jgi:hypothetical protein
MLSVVDRNAIDFVLPRTKNVALKHLTQVRRGKLAVYRLKETAHGRLIIVAIRADSEWGYIGHARLVSAFFRILASAEALDRIPMRGRIDTILGCQAVDLGLPLRGGQPGTEV